MLRVMGILGLVGLLACGDDDGFLEPDAGNDAGTDTGVGDGGTDGGDDAGDDGGSDASEDTGPVDTGTDVPPDVPPEMCGAGPACEATEVCWGSACSCVVEIDGDSYLRTDGRVVYMQGSLNPLAETAAGVPLEGAIEIMDGWRHTCALLEDETVWCWAKNASGGTFGELGNGSTSAGTPMRAVQVMIDDTTPLTGITHLSNRNNSRCYIDITTCGIRGSDGALFCWGGDQSGGGSGSFFTLGAVANRPYATQIQASDGVPLTNVVEVSLGLRHACAIDADRALLCWGMNVGGPLGLGDANERRYPTVVDLPGDVSVDEVGTGGDFTCARSDDTVFCWGATQGGRVGYTTDIPGESDGCINFCELNPAQVIDTTGAAISGVRELEVNYLSACAMMEDDTLLCWGAGVGDVATEPTFTGGLMLENVADMTSCSSTEIDMGAIRYIQRDGTLTRGTSPVTLVCP